MSPVEVRFGSDSDVATKVRNVRSTLTSRHHQAVPASPLCVKAKRTWRGRRFERLSIIELACARWSAIPTSRSSELVRALGYFSLASGFVIARTLSMKSCVARLRDRFFSVMIATLRRVLGKSTGRTLSDGCLRGSKTQ